MRVHAGTAAAMAPATLLDTLVLSHSLALQHNVRFRLQMKVAFHCLRRRVHNPALAGKDGPSISQGLWSSLPAGPKPTVSETRPLYEHGLVLSGDCRDHAPHLGSLPEQLNHTPRQEEDIRNPEKYGKAELATGPPLPVLAERPGRA